MRTLTSLEKDRRDALILGHLARYPGLTSYELARVMRFFPPVSSPRNRCSEGPAEASLARLASAGLAVSTDEPCMPGDFGWHTWRRLWYAVAPDGHAIRGEDQQAQAGRSGPAECGTYAGFQRHARAGERACDVCRQARADYIRDWRHRRAARKPASYRQEQET